MPTKPNRNGQQEYVPAGNGDASGEYAGESGSNKHFESFKQPNTFQEFTKSTAKQEFIEKTGFKGTSEFDDFTKKQTRDVYNGARKVIKDFPEITKHIKVFSSATGRNNIQYDPYVGGVFFPNHDGTVSIFMNQKFYIPEDDLEFVDPNEMQQKFNDKLSYYTIHEFGHAIAWLVLGETDDNFFKPLYKGTVHDDLLKICEGHDISFEMTDYAETNDAELIAEAFAMHYKQHSCSLLANKIFNYVKKLYNKKFKGAKR